MKTKTLILLIMATLFSFGDKMYAQTSDNGTKILVAYYSLHNGNTRVVAEQIQKNVGGDLFRIETVDAYPSEYNDVTKQAKEELQLGYRPPLKSIVTNFDQYDVIYLGSPNWWNTITPAVMTFLESYNFEGKTILPFVTHEGSRLGASVEDVKKLAPKASVLKGLPVRGRSVQQAEPEVKAWLKEVGMAK